jgi:hypothetical protein
MNDDTIELKTSVGKKVAYIIIALMISLIAGNIVFIPFVIIVSTHYISNLPNLIGGVIFIVGISLDIVVIVICFKKVCRFFIK